MLDGNAIARAEREGIEDGVERVCGSCARWVSNGLGTAGICLAATGNCTGYMSFFADNAKGSTDPCDREEDFEEN